MGKIKTEGRVTLEFEPDLYEISITVRAEGKTSGAAVTAGKKQTETLLQSLQENLQIKPEQLLAEREALEKPSCSDNKTISFQYSRTLCLTIPADNQLREAVTAQLSKMDDVTYIINVQLADENTKKQIALDAAIQKAKEKAEHMAESLGCKVIGFEEMFTDNTESRRMEFKKSEINRKYGGFGSCPLAAELQNPKIKIAGSVIVIWLTEPLT